MEAPRRKPTYQQALALQAGQATARRAARSRAASAPVALSDDETLSFLRTFSTPLLERRLRSRRTPSSDKVAIRAVLAERSAT